MIKFKKIFAGLLVSITILTISPIEANAEWKKNSIGWWYTEGNSYLTGWQLIDGSWYYLNNDGSMVTNGLIDGFNLGNDGKMISPSYYNTMMKLAEEESLKDYYSQKQPVIVEEIKHDDSNDYTTEEIIQRIDDYMDQMSESDEDESPLYN
ncbi:MULTISPECIES: choline-binding protein [unclassified Clostridium]|uniref:choline-binding protein n=1 Tax=unclassified Clostridium TaxID=2614128 RepID=UPI00207ADDA6